MQPKVWPHWVPRRLEVEKTLPQYIQWWAEWAPERVALAYYGTDITYRRLNAMCNRFANALVRLGVSPGDRVALFMQNSIEFVISYVGSLKAGAIVVPINPMLKAEELQYMLSDSGAKVVVLQDSLIPELEKITDNIPVKAGIVTSLRQYLPSIPVIPLSEEMAERARSSSDYLRFHKLVDEAPESPIDRSEMDAVALLEYTGGTTGLPKGAMLTNRAIVVACVATMFWYNYDESDVFMGVTPFFHIMGQQQMMATALVTGAKVVVLPRFQVDIVKSACEYYGCTAWVTAPTAIIALINAEVSLPSLRIFWTGGASISTDLQKRMQQLAPRAIIGEGYGLTEALPQGGAITPLMRWKPGYVGIPQISELKIVDPDDPNRERKVEEEGEILLKGPTIMVGYWRREQETQEAFMNGWLLTGDIGAVDEEGYLRLAGRKKEIIKCSGYSVFPAEVEALLYKHPAVKEAAVIGIPDEYRGESPKAFIVLKDEFRGSVKEEDILEWAKEHIAAYKRPREVEFRDELPKSAAGKVLRRVLAEEEAKKYANGEKRE